MDETIYLILSPFLVAVEVLSTSEVSRSWHRYSNSNVIWRELLDRLISDRVYVPDYIHSLKSSVPKIAYFLAIADSRRCFMSTKEFTSFLWSQRFKEMAGEYWLQLCLWNQGRQARTLRFNEQGDVEFTSSGETADLLARNFNSLKWRLSWSATSKRRRARVLNRYANFIQHIDELIEATMYPRFLFPDETMIISVNNMPFEDQSPLSKELVSLINAVYNDGMDLFQGGDCMLLEVNGVPVPTYRVARSPTDNWGFTLESCWALYTSWAMPLKGQCPLLEDDMLTIRAEDQLHEVITYNRRIVLGAALEEDEDDEYIGVDGPG